MARAKETKRVWTKVEANIRRVDRVRVRADGALGEPTALVGFEVRVGQKRAGPLQPTITKARELRSRALADVARGVHVAPSDGKATVREVIDLWLAGDQLAEAKPTTAATYRSIAVGSKRGLGRLAPLHPLPVNRVTVAEVRKFRAGLIRDGLRPLSVVKILNVLSFVMDTAVDEGMIAANPCDKARRDRGRKGPKKAATRRVTIPQMEDVEALLDTLAGLDNAKAGEWSLYAEVAAYAGLRAGEICGLRVRNVNVLGRSVTVESNAVDVNGTVVIGTPKSADSLRTVTELPHDLAQRLGVQCSGRAADDFVFGDGVTPSRHKNFYRRVFVPTAAAAGLSGLHFHDLRHFYASDLLRDPHLSVKDVAHRLGHADPTLVLRTYGHLFADAGVGLGDRVAARRAAARAKAQRQAVAALG